MNALASTRAIAPAITLDDEMPLGGGDYDIVRRVIEKISLDYRDQPSLEELAEAVGETPTGLQKLFTRWAGLSPKAFLQAVTLDRARPLLASDASLLDASMELGLSGPARLHDLFVTHEAITPGDFKARGAGIEVRWAFHPSPFGTAVVIASPRGLAGLAFADDGGEAEALADMQRRWPLATYVHDQAGTVIGGITRLSTLIISRVVLSRPSKP